MPTYDYRCPECSDKFAVVKRIAQADDIESCPSCLAACDKKSRLITAKVFFGEKPDEAFYSQALGKWVKSKKDQAMQAKQKGWVEVGNENVENIHKAHDAIREKKSQDSWKDLINPDPYTVRGA